MVRGACRCRGIKNQFVLAHSIALWADAMALSPFTSSMVVPTAEYLGVVVASRATGRARDEQWSVAQITQVMKLMWKRSVCEMDERSRILLRVGGSIQL